jgi:hypothetical protein
MKRLFNSLFKTNQSTDAITTKDIEYAKELIAIKAKCIEKHMDGELTDKEFIQQCINLHMIGYDPYSDAFDEARREILDEEIKQLELELNIIPK